MVAGNYSYVYHYGSNLIRKMAFITRYFEIDNKGGDKEVPVFCVHVFCV